jgi:hypothetical protein
VRQVSYGILSKGSRYGIINVCSNVMGSVFGGDFFNVLGIRYAQIEKKDEK